MSNKTERPPGSADAGYTLTELLVVIVVLALVAAAITPQIMGRFNSAKIRTAQLQANTLSASMDDFYVDVGRYPTPEEGIEALLSAPDGVTGWLGPYVRSASSLKDPWGRAYKIKAAPDLGAPPKLVSLGADGAEGGEGPNGDIESN